MPRLQPIKPDQAGGKVRELLREVESRMGMVPNLFLTMAHSPGMLEGFLKLRGALEEGVLPENLREQISLAVAEANRSEYCVCGHTALGKSVGLSEEEIMDARHGQAPDRKVQAALHFAWEVVDRRGDVTDDDVNRLREAGYSDREIVEIIVLVGLNTLADYLAQVIQPALDFPRPAEMAHA
jgi:uncharacterized peroxidase-related enzyme